VEIITSLGVDPYRNANRVMQLDGEAGSMCCRDCLERGSTGMTNSEGAWRWAKEYVGSNSGFIFKKSSRMVLGNCQEPSGM